MRIGRFEKVSFKQFLRGIDEAISKNDGEGPLSSYRFKTEDYINTNIYSKIKLPTRATKHSAGYDFFYPFEDTVLFPGQSIVIPTGIKVKIFHIGINPHLVTGSNKDDACDLHFFLGIYTKSSHGFNNNIKQDDTIAIIDADYYNNKDNEGHIFIKLRNEHEEKPFNLLYGQKIAQGIFQMYGITEDDNVTATRNGGLGSTSR